MAGGGVCGHGVGVLAVRELHRQGHECAEGTAGHAAGPPEVAVKLTAAGLV